MPITRLAIGQELHASERTIPACRCSGSRNSRRDRNLYGTLRPKLRHGQGENFGVGMKRFARIC
jgi:hypothetical protein